MDRRTVSQKILPVTRDENNVGGLIMQTLGPNGRTIGVVRSKMFTVPIGPVANLCRNGAIPMDELRACPDANAMISLIVSPGCL